MPPAFIARQPIFNNKLEAVGYELLFRGRGYATEALIENAESATATVVLNSLTELDLKRIVGNKTAWFNVSREFVLDGLAQVMPAGHVGLEIPEEGLFDDDLTTALHDLKAQGYRLALDDFQSRPGSEALLELFDVVKLSMVELGRERLTDQVERLRPYPCVLLADKLGNRSDHEFCSDIGFELFQGYFFCRPSVMGTHSIAANRLAIVQVVAALQDPEVQLSDIEQLIARDVALSFRLLRYVNSAFFGLRGDVRSIGQALALLGIENIRRWATLSVLASIDDKPTELTVTALIRARFCELAGSQLGIASPAELFTLGLFSVIDAMMDAPMHDVVASLPLADDMREALVLRRGWKGELLNCVAALENGEDGHAHTIVLDAGERYLESVMWANAAAESLLGEPGAGAGDRDAASADADGRTGAANGGPADANGAHALHVLDTSHSKPPPGIQSLVVDEGPAEGRDDQADGAAAAGESTRPGAIERFFAKVRGLFGRRRER